MSVTITHQFSCDLCGDDIGTPDRHTYVGGGATAAPQVAHAQFRRTDWLAPPMDLCEACAAPLEEALIDRVVVLQAEGRIRSAA